MVAPLSLAAMVVMTSRAYPKGLPAVGVGCVVYTAVTCWALIDIRRGY